MSTEKLHASGIYTGLIESLEKARERILKSRNVLLGPLDTDIATTPYEVVYEEDRIRLKHYKPANPNPNLKTPLLMVYALINRETMLDLQPGRSVVQNLLAQGVDLYMIDWGYPTRKDRYLTISDHVNGYMDNVIDFILERNNIPQLNLMGICMGGTFSILYSALHPEKVKNLITTVTPSNFDTNKGLLHVWTKNLDLGRVVDAYGNVPGDLLNIGFLLLNPARLIIDKYISYFENIDNKEYIENFIRMEKWIFDSPDVPGETIRQFIEDGYHKNLLIQSKMKLDGEVADLSKITMPLLNIYGKFDHLVPPEACELLTGKVGSDDTEDVCLDTGHIGIYVSSKTQKQFIPKIIDWLTEREGDAAPSRSSGAARSQSAQAQRPVPAGLDVDPVAPAPQAESSMSKAKPAGPAVSKASSPEAAAQPKSPAAKPQAKRAPAKAATKEPASAATPAPTK